VYAKGEFFSTHSLYLRHVFASSSSSSESTIHVYSFTYKRELGQIKSRCKPYPARLPNRIWLQIRLRGAHSHSASMVDEDSESVSLLLTILTLRNVVLNQSTKEKGEQRLRQH
jgi:hypothetical protein